MLNNHDVVGLFKPWNSHVIGVNANALDILDALFLSLSHKALFASHTNLFISAICCCGYEVESVVVWPTYRLSVPCLDSIVEVGWSTCNGCSIYIYLALLM